MLSINNPEGWSLNSDNTKVDLIAITGNRHIGLVASVLLLALALPFFLLYSFFALSNINHQVIIALTIGYALWLVRAQTLATHSKILKYDHSNSVSYA